MEKYEQSNLCWCSSLLPFLSFSVSLSSYTFLTNDYLLILFAFKLPHQVVHQLEVRMLSVQKTPTHSPHFPSPPSPLIFVFHYPQLCGHSFTQNYVYLVPCWNQRSHHNASKIKRTLKSVRPDVFKRNIPLENVHSSHWVRQKSFNTDQTRSAHRIQHTHTHTHLPGYSPCNIWTGSWWDRGQVPGGSTGRRLD